MSKIFTITEGLQNLGALRTGGQGSVYKGMRMGPVYSAIKLIPTPIYVEDESDKNYRNFINEVTKLEQVNINPSPHVVKILSSGITDSGSFPFIEMEYIEGPELSELLLPPNQKVFTVKEILKVAEQLAAALSHCHQVDVKHGDIKSNNVKYNVQTSNYVLLDFGLAIMSDEQRRTSIRHAGAIEFMAPEQHEGKMLLQTDIYSYGIILYELLAGQVPFPLEGNGDTGRNTVMIGHLEKEIPDAMALRRNNLLNAVDEQMLTAEMQVPKWLIHLIDRCLKKDPAERFANGMELHQAVTNNLISSAPQDFRNVERSLPNESLNFAVRSIEAREKTEKLENELANLRLIAFKAGISFNQKNGNYQYGDYLRIPRKVFLGSAAMFLLLLAFLSYSFFNTPDTAATPAQVTTYVPPFLTYHEEYQKKLLKNREDSIQAAKLQAAEKVKTAGKQNGKKKKRKKFLGIF